MNITFVSHWPAARREELETLLYFNSNQHILRRAIMVSVAEYGVPRLVEKDGSLLLCIDRLGELQTLFGVVDDTLAGALLYYRLDVARLIVLHLAMREEYTARYKYISTPMALLLFEQLVGISRRLVGIEYIEMFDARGRRVIV